MTEKKRKRSYWLFKILSVVISCALPIWAIWEKFPIWTYTYGTTRSVGVGGILALIVVLVVFRKAVFNFIRDKLKLRHAPPLAVWLVMLIISYILVYIGNFIRDLNTIFWMGLIGCAIGSVLTFIAEHRFGKNEEKNDG
jgi:hypothetical protein